MDSVWAASTSGPVTRQQSKAKKITEKRAPFALPLAALSLHNTIALKEAFAVDENERAVFIIIGRVWREKDGPETGVHILLSEADDDSAVREGLNALAERGYAEAEFDQIGTLTDAPIEEPHASAYQGAMEGEIAIIEFDDEDTPVWEEEDPEPRKDGRFIDDDDEDYDPFAALKDWKPE